MTIRLSAMFDEHMRRIIYNWKSARRRENSNRTKNKKLRSRRKNGQRSTRHHSSDEDGSEVTFPITPVRKTITPRKTNLISNGHAGTSRSSEPLTRSLIKKEKPFKDSSDVSDDSEKNDSGDSYKPNSRGKKIVKKIQVKRPKNFCSESDLNDISKRTRAKTNITNPSDSESDSDNEPLVNCVNSWTNNLSSNANADDSDDSSSEEVVNPRLRSSHDETSQCSSSRPTRQVKRNYSNNSFPQENRDESEESSDEQVPSRLRASHDEASQCSSSRQTRKSRKSYTSSESENAHLPQRSARVKRFNYRKMLEFSEDSDEENINPRTRKGKRPHYNEDSNEDENNASRRNKRRHVNDDSDSNDTTNIISISSRGRIRKLTPRAKAFLRD